MELAKIRNLSDAELSHQEKTSAEQLFRLRFQVSMGQNDGVKKLRELRKEIAQIKTIARERDLGLHGEVKGAVESKAADAAASKTAKKPAAAKKPRKAKTAEPAAEAKSVKAKGARK